MDGTATEEANNAEGTTTSSTINNTLQRDSDSSGTSSTYPSRRGVVLRQLRCAEIASSSGTVQDRSDEAHVSSRTVYRIDKRLVERRSHAGFFKV